MPDTDLLDSSPFQKANPQLFTPPAAPNPAPTAKNGNPGVDYTNQRMELATKASGIEDEEITKIREMRSKWQSMASRHTPIPRDPNFQPIPKAPVQDFTDPLKVFQNPAVVLATLGSLFSRAPLTAALDAGGAAMEAYHKGEAEKFTLKRDEWKEAVEASKAQNEIELQKYNAAWKKSDAAVKDKLAEMQAIAAGVKDEVMIAGIKTGQLDRIDKIFLDARQKATDKLEESLLKLKEQQEYHQLIYGAKKDAATARSMHNWLPWRISGTNLNLPLRRWTLRKNAVFL